MIFGGTEMKDFRQNGFNAAAGCMLLLGALLRAISCIDSIKVVKTYSELNYKLDWQIWVTVIAGVLVAVLMALAGIFMLKARDDLYSKAIMGVGGIILIDYAIVVSYLFSMVGALGRSYLMRWQYILIYGAMICYGLCFFLSGKYAMSVLEEPSPTNSSQWLQAPLTYVAGVVMTIIAAIGFGSSPLDLFSTTPSEQWMQILSFILDFLIVFLAAKHLRKVETDAYLMKTDKPEITGVPPFNANTYQPFQTDAQRFREQQAFGAGLGYAAQQFNAQNGRGAGAPQYNGQNGQGYGAPQYNGQNGQGYGAPQYNAQNPQNGPMFGQAPAVDFSKGIDMPQKSDLSKGIDMPKNSDRSGGIDMPQGINMPVVDIPEGNFDELLSYGRQQGYGRDEVDMNPAGESGTDDSL